MKTTYDSKSKKILIEVDVSGEGKISSTGKSKIIASTGGFKRVDNSPFRLNLVVIKRKEDG